MLARRRLTTVHCYGVGKASISSISLRYLRGEGIPSLSGIEQEAQCHVSASLGEGFL
jgi:hypothetical protein